MIFTQAAPSSYLQRIFDPFFTIKADDTGLGLSISYGLIENNGGKIEVKSRMGEGSTFIILLPFQGGGKAGAPDGPKGGQGLHCFDT
jgi:signal transduction histidine kinase